MNPQIIVYAPLFASVVAVAAFLSGLWQFRRTQYLTREVKAVELFLKFNELNQELVEAIGMVDKASHFWKHNALIAIVEAVFNLTEGNKFWEATVRWMLITQKDYLLRHPIDCNTYAPAFLSVLKSTVPQLRCT